MFYPNGRVERVVKVGYARVSTRDQEAGYEAQKQQLLTLGCEKLFTEPLSSVAEHRPQLEAMIDFIREGDEVLVTKVDRLARSVRDLVAIIDRIKAKGAALEIENLGRVNGSPTSGLILNVLGAIAQFEREIMLERQRDGIAKAKAEGKYKGRAKTAQRLAGQVRTLAAEGWARSAIVEHLSCQEKHKHGPKCWRISERSVYRILAGEQAAE
jgi:DNA invertase Pin-like site-specific DNA recombinase